MDQNITPEGAIKTLEVISSFIWILAILMLLFMFSLFIVYLIDKFKARKSKGFKNPTTLD